MFFRINKSMPYYFFTRTQFNIGTVIKPVERDVFWLGPKVEMLLEKGRPSNCNTRMRCYFVYDDIYAKPDRYCFEVNEIEPLEKGHTGWLELIKKHQDADWLALQEWVRCYWEGADCIHCTGVLQYRATSTRVVKLAEKAEPKPARDFQVSLSPANTRGLY